MEFNSIFQKYTDNHQKLSGMFTEAETLFEKLESTEDLQQLVKNSESLNRDSFKVLVIGEFKRGKSTVINALLGEEVLPAYATPCTAVINEIKYGEEKRAILHFADKLPEPMPKLANDVAAHIAAYKKDGKIPPMEIPVDRIEEFVVIPDPGKDQAESVAQSPFALVEIYWPIDLCKNRVEIIDSPGLNEHGTRTKVTMDYLAEVDAIVFVLSCHALASQTELQVISDSIIASGHEDIFFVCNRFDEVRERERDRLKAYAQKRLCEKTSLENGIHFLSALNALDAKLDNNPDALKESGFQDLEQHLVSFLVNDRGRIKITRPAAALKRQINRAVCEIIPMQQNMLSADLAELQKRFDSEKPKLDDAEKRRLLIKEKIARKTSRVKDETRRDIMRYMKELAREIPEIVQSYETEAQVTFLSLENTKTQCEDLMRELLQKLEDDITTRQNQWVNTELLPDIKNKLQDIFENTTADLEAFLETIDSVKNNLAGHDVCEDQRDVPVWERVAAAGVGALTVSYGSVIQGGQDGFKGLLKSILPQVGVALGMIVLGVTNPWIFIPALIATGGISAYFSNSKLEKIIREKLGEKVKNSILDSVEENAETAIEKLSIALDEIAEQVDSGMQKEINGIQQSVDNVLKIKQEGENKAKQRETVLLEQRKNAAALIDKLEDLLEQL